jgi:dihydrofolate reductase
MRIVVLEHVSLDGVMQGPGRADEDDRDGFTHSGWASGRGGDEDVVTRAIGARTAPVRGWLFGRRTYDDLLGHWTAVADSPFGDQLTAATKYVATTRAGEPLAWPNTTALLGASVGSSEVTDAVAHLRDEGDGVLGVMGSSVLVHALQRAALVDEYVLVVYPIVLGAGRRLFADAGRYEELALVEPVVTSRAGVAVMVYQPRG